MTQIFFISPTGFPAVTDALRDIIGQNTHAWTQDGTTQCIGVVEVRPNGDGEAIATALELAGIIVLPDHRFNGQVGKAIVDALSPYGVNASDNTSTAMVKVMGTSKFPAHKPKRFV